MASIVALPSLGESVAEATVGAWAVREGERVVKDQVLVEILTDKADAEVRAPSRGVVTKIVAPEGTVVAVGASLCELEDGEAVADRALPPAAPTPSPRPASAPATSTAARSGDDNGGSARVANASQAVPPSVRKLAREQGIDLSRLAGTGGGGRVTRDDVLRAGQPEPAVAADRAATPSPKALAPAQGPSPRAGGRLAFQVPPYTPRAGDEVVPFSRRRRIIADHMVYSKLTSPHVLTVAECDLHRTARVRDEHKTALKKQGLNLTYLAFIASATCRALREHRVLNARVLDDAFVLLRDVNLGIAVDTDEGLVVPVVRNADGLTVKGLAQAIEELARKAREGDLTPDDLGGKTFTISNPGLKGNLFGAAIISQPNVGILRVGEIQKRVVVVEHDGEDLTAIRPVTHLSLSYDHRIVDGVAANSFLWRVVELLEAGDFEL